jgi:excisionase family DNA binding protein
LGKALLARFPNLEDQLIDADQAAVILRTTRRFVVREIAQKGRIPVVRIDRRAYRFWLSDVLRYAEALTEENPIRPPRPAKVTTKTKAKRAVT